MNFQNRLYQLRKEKGISQEELADVVGVSRQAVQKWEAGSSQPAMDNLTSISRYFGVTLDYLIQGAQDDPDGDAHFPYSRYPFWHYEYKSKHTLLGLPLVHINFQQMGLCRAKGIIAIGNVATGILSIGLLSVGALAIGPLALGLAAMGGIAMGGVAIGGLSIGLLALGGAAIGVYSLGGGAIALNVAAGGGAMGHIAIGDGVQGVITFQQEQWGQPGTAEAIAAAIRQTYPYTPSWLVTLFSSLG